MLCWLGLADPLAFVRVELQFGMLAWLANPLAFVGAVLLLARRPTGAAAFGAASIVVGAQYVIDPPDHRPLALAPDRSLALVGQLARTDGSRPHSPWKFAGTKAICASS